MRKIFNSVFKIGNSQQAISDKKQKTKFSFFLKIKIHPQGLLASCQSESIFVVLQLC